ncbi:MAG: aminoacyl-tRNA deacylase [Coriobacteriia bacterium]|nr:aminoacyl-tRNA deacylase [Coriobacteriia bacterium]
MAKKQEKKTNAVRELERTGAAYVFHSFDGAEGLSGVEIAQMRGDDPDHVFKTLVTIGHSGEHYVFMIPVAEELDLKKAASAVGEKSVHMIKSKELLPLTGYVHGGCSPLGMKKRFVTTIDETAELYDTILFSGGRIGAQIETSLAALQQAIPVVLADLTA